MNFFLTVLHKRNLANAKLLLFFFLLLTQFSATCCTIFKYVANGKVFVGSNEDFKWSTERVKVWFEVGNDSKFDVAYFGFDSEGGPQSGMNECGLVLDGAAAPD